MRLTGGACAAGARLCVELLSWWNQSGSIFWGQLIRDQCDQLRVHWQIQLILTPHKHQKNHSSLLFFIVLCVCVCSSLSAVRLATKDLVHHQLNSLTISEQMSARTHTHTHTYWRISFKHYRICSVPQLNQTIWPEMKLRNRIYACMFMCVYTGLCVLSTCCRGQNHTVKIFRDWHGWPFLFCLTILPFIHPCN